MPVPTEVRGAYQRKLDAIIAQVDRLTEAGVQRALALAEEARRQILDRLVALPSGSFEARHLRGLRSEIDRAIASLVRRYQADVKGLLERAQELGIDLAEDPLKEAARIAAGANPVLPGGVVGRQALEVLQGFSVDLIQGLGDDTRRRILSVVNQAALGNVGGQTAIARIAGALPERSTFATLASRAEAIFRTETGRAFSLSADARMGQMHARLPGLKKEWVSVLDDKTRESHAEAHGQVVPADGSFEVGGWPAKYPRDPLLPAGESVNCRCWHVPVIDDEVMRDLGVTGPVGGAAPPTPEPAPIAEDDWLDGEITDIEDFPSDSVNRVRTGKIAEHRVHIKAIRDINPEPSTWPTKSLAFLTRDFLT